MDRWLGCSGALALMTLSCGATVPAFYPRPTERIRESAYDWFYVATGEGRDAGREPACANAEAQAWSKLAALFVDEVETASDVVAVAGGPARVRALLAAYLTRVRTEAVRTQGAYDDGARRCYVELRWRRPRHLAVAISRALALKDTEESVGAEIKRALTPAGESSVAARADASPTAEGAVEKTYRGWFKRMLAVPDCQSHRLAFVGSPGGTEARWLELKNTEVGWVLIDDRRIPDAGWPAPPTLSLCD